MRIGICFFIDSNLGGAATQADDMVSAARALGHTACLLRFTHNPRSRGLHDLKKPGLPGHELLISQAGMRFTGDRILTTKGKSRDVVRWVDDNLDLLVFVGGCPHVKGSTEQKDGEGVVTHDSSKTFDECYRELYTRTKCCKVMFFTDPFWKNLYPYCQDVVGSMDRVYAFAEAYRRAVIESGLHDDVRVCNFGSMQAARRSRKTSLKRRVNAVVWPHQWRSWKNPLLFVKMVPHLNCPVRAYADGIEYHNTRRDYRPDWEAAVAFDEVKREVFNVTNNMTYRGTVPQARIMDEFSTCRWMVDLTGMSGRTGKDMDKFVGNYQCVNIECMMLGCVNFKYENTVSPHSQIPADCVIPLPRSTDPRELAAAVNDAFRPGVYKEVAHRAREWAMNHFDPVKVFDEDFVKPFWGKK